MKKYFYRCMVSASLLLAGCATTVPPAVSIAPANAPALAQMQAAPQQYQGRKLRFGGRIIEVENRVGESWISIIALPLKKSGEPQASDQTPGRFIAIVKGFADPQVFNKNRRITISGRFQKLQRKKIGEYAYPYPLIEVDVYHLWPVKRNTQTPAL